MLLMGLAFNPNFTYFKAKISQNFPYFFHKFLLFHWDSLTENLSFFF